MNVIKIRAPRWKDRTLLIADWKIGRENKIIIQCKKVDGTLFYPEPITVAGTTLKSYPVENKPYGKMRVVPLADLGI